jgi:hypothetical protein
LAFLRTRHSFGDASDLARIKAQQYFLGSMVRKIKSDNTLNDLPKVYAIADAITKNLTIDKGLANISSMMAIANRLKAVDPAKVAFVTVPNVADPADPNRVVLNQPGANDLFAAVRNNQDLTAGATAATPTAGATAGATPSAGASGTGTPSTTAATPPAAPAYNKAIQPITILNGSGVAGRNTDLVAALAAAGYTDTGQASAPAISATVVAYGPNFADVGADVGALFGIPATSVVPDPGIVGVQLRVGSDFSSGTTFGKAVLPQDIVSSTAGQSGGCLVVNPEQYPELYGR